MVRQAHHHPEPGRRANHNDQNSKFKTIGFRSCLRFCGKKIVLGYFHCLYTAIYELTVLDSLNVSYSPVRYVISQSAVYERSPNQLAHHRCFFHRIMLKLKFYLRLISNGAIKKICLIRLN
jgi:hypothetical protein